MFGNTKSGVNAYARVGVETGVSSASPHKLIVMLYDGALASLSSAMLHMKSGNIPEKGKAISKAITIIDSGLRSCLDKNAGGQIAQNLDALYEYMTLRLAEANMKNKVEMIEEVHKLLFDLRATWESIGKSADQTVSGDAPQTPVRIPSYDQLSPKTSSLVRA